MRNPKHPIRLLREHYSVPLATLAEGAGISRRTIQYIESFSPSRSTTRRAILEFFESLGAHINWHRSDRYFPVLRITQRRGDLDPLPLDGFCWLIEQHERGDHNAAAEYLSTLGYEAPDRETLAGWLETARHTRWEGE